MKHCPFQQELWKPISVRLNGYMFLFRSVQNQLSRDCNSIVSLLDMRLWRFLQHVVWCLHCRHAFDWTVKVRQCLALGLDLGIAAGNSFPFHTLEFRGSKPSNARVPKKHMRNAGMFVVWFVFFHTGWLVGFYLRQQEADTLVGGPGCIGRGLVSLCRAWCVFMMSLAHLWFCVCSYVSSWCLSVSLCVSVWARLVGLGAVLFLCVVWCVFMMYLWFCMCLSMGGFGGVGKVLSLRLGDSAIMVGKADSPSQIWRGFCFLITSSACGFWRERWTQQIPGPPFGVFFWLRPKTWRKLEVEKHTQKHDTKAQQYGCGSKCKVWIKPRSHTIQTSDPDLSKGFDPDLWSRPLEWCNVLVSWCLVQWSLQSFTLPSSQATNCCKATLPSCQASKLHLSYSYEAKQSSSPAAKLQLLHIPAVKLPSWHCCKL